MTGPLLSSRTSEALLLASLIKEAQLRKLHPTPIIRLAPFASDQGVRARDLCSPERAAGAAGLPRVDCRLEVPLPQLQSVVVPDFQGPLADENGELGHLVLGGVLADERCHVLAVCAARGGEPVVVRVEDDVLGRVEVGGPELRGLERVH